MIDVYSDFNNQVVDGIMLGSMEGNIRWISGEVLGLQKRIEYHKEVISKTEDGKVKEELKDRLASYVRRLNDFKTLEINQNYITVMDMIYDSNNAPYIFFSLWRRKTQEKFILKIKFWINFSGRKKVKLAVENVIPRNTSNQSFKGPYHIYECKDLEKIPGILFTLPSLITEKVVVNNLKNIQPYIYDLRTK